MPACAMGYSLKMFKCQQNEVKHKTRLDLVLKLLDIVDVL